ncbi:MAG: Flp family type IVb pilin [Caulobacteraceae bacterium]
MRFHHNRSAATAVEYALIGALVSIVIIAGRHGIGNHPQPQVPGRQRRGHRRRPLEPVRKRSGAGKPLGVTVRRAAVVDGAAARNRHEVADTARRRDPRAEFPVPDPPTLDRPHRGLDAGRRKRLGRGLRRWPRRIPPRSIRRV